jgi:uncharacterized protein
MLNLSKVSPALRRRLVTLSSQPLPPMLPWDRRTFLNLAGGFEGGLVLLALGLAWLTGLDLWEITWFSLTAVGQSLAALAPLVALFGVTYRWPAGPLQRIKEFLLEGLGPPLSACRWYDLVLIAALAGLGEELLFRGVMQTGVDRWAGRGVGLLSAALIFGLVHAVTRTYAVLAGLIGMYLGGLLYVWEPPNLLVPILVHALYDLVAFWVVRTDFRNRANVASPAP